MDKQTVNLNALRIVEAISRIGYKPSAAIMDIVDNSVMAKAKNIAIEFDIDENIAINRKNNVITYRISDDGIGMSKEAIVNALTPGSDNNYSENSLSKYGMGLKSAGFSLGEKICVLSKVQDVDTSVVAYVDVSTMDENYYVHTSDKYNDLFENDILGDLKSGTAIEIRNVHVPHEAAMTTINVLAEKLGVTYYGFLSSENDPLNITIKYHDKHIKVEPHDMLFKENAKSEYHADDYDYKTVCHTLKDYEIELEDAPDAEPIKVNVALFPRDLMKNYGGFTKEEKKLVASYKISSKNKGFYVYRNGRLIRWGDTLSDGKGGTLIPRDAYNIRGTIEFETQHDDALHVDVSKQRFDLPAQVSEALKEVLTYPLEHAKEIMKSCTEKYTDFESLIEGDSFNETNSELYEEDSMEYFEPSDQIAEKVKIDKLKEETKKLQDELAEELKGADEILIDEKVVPKKIRYSEKLPSDHLWKTGYDSDTGVFVVINKLHPYYDLVFKQYNESSPERQSLEAIFWSIAAAEKIIRTKMDVEEQVLLQVLERFKSDFSYNINHWVRQNFNLFD